jgi:Zn-dependent M16 (insulinase) family peptidase
MFELVKEVLTCPIFNNKDLLTTHISSTASGLQESLMDSGHRYALTNATAPFRLGTQLNETYHGINQVSFMSDLLVKAQEGQLDETIDKLQQLSKFLLNKPIAKVSVSVEQQYAKEVETRLSDFLEGTFSQPRPSGKNLGDMDFTPGKPAKNYIPMPGTVNYVAKALPTVHYNHPDAPYLQLLSEVVTHQYLHREIREKGGAYGSGLSFHTGYVGFYSYRDPHIERTLDTFSGTLKWLKNTSIKDEWVQQAKFHVFQGIDAPVSPSKKGITEFNTGITYDMRQRKREKLLSATKDDLLGVAEKYLGSEDKASVSVMGSENNTKFKEDQTWNYIES